MSKKLTKVFLFLTLFFVMSINALASESPEVKTNGNATLTAKPDLATINIGVNTENVNGDVAINENSQILNNIMNYLKTAGIPSEDIETSYFYTSPKYNYEDNGLSHIVGYKVYNSISIKIRNFDIIPDIISKSISLGANSISDVSFDIENKNQLYNKALLLAIDDAVYKGKAIGDNLGYTDLNVININETSSNQVYSSKSYAMDSVASTESLRDVSVPVAPNNISVNASVEIILK